MRANNENFITLIRRRKEEGILYVIDTYGAYLRAVVRKRLSKVPNDRIDECLNDVFWGIWKNIDSFDETKGSFLNWASGIARLEAIDFLRRLGRELAAVGLDELELQQEDAQLLSIVERELSEETQELLSHLGPKDRELFLRIYVNEEEPQRVSSEMGMTRENLYVRLFRGKKKMRMIAAKRKEI